MICTLLTAIILLSTADCSSFTAVSLSYNGSDLITTQHAGDSVGHVVSSTSTTFEGELGEDTASLVNFEDLPQFQLPSGGYGVLMPRRDYIALLSFGNVSRSPRVIWQKECGALQ